MHDTTEWQCSKIAKIRVKEVQEQTEAAEPRQGLKGTTGYKILPEGHFYHFTCTVEVQHEIMEVQEEGVNLPL